MTPPSDAARPPRTSRARRLSALTALFALANAAAGCSVERVAGGVADTRDASDTQELPDTAEEADTADDVEIADAVDVIDALDADAPDAPDVRPPTPCPWTDYGEGLKGGAVTWVDFDPRAPDVAFAVAGGLLSRSVDGGATWQRWSEGDTGFGQLAFPRDDPKLVLATSGAGLIASNDGGLTFSVRSLQGFGLRSIFVPEALPQRVFVGTRGAGVLRSDDHGVTWVALNVGVPLAEIRTLTGPPEQPSVVVAGAILLNPNLGYSNSGQLLYSSNGGATWTVALDGVGWGNHVVYCDDQTAFAAVRTGLVRSDDGGATWAPTAGLAGRDVLHVAVAPDCERLVALVYQSGFYSSADGGATVAGPFTAGLELEPDRITTNALVAAPDDPSTLFAATYAGLFRSQDDGESWQVIDSGNGVAIGGLTPSPAAPGRLFASTWGTGVWQRESAESEWERVSVDRLPRDFIYGTYVDLADPDRWFVGAVRELWRTEDAGETYVSVGLANYNVLDVVTLASGTTLAATQIGGVFRSADGGDTWAPSNGDLAPFPTAAGTFIDARHLLESPSGVVFLGTNGGGLFTSEDDGLSWVEVGADQGVELVNELALHAGPPERLYAVVADRGVVRSDDGGATWSSGSTGLASLDIRDLALDATNGDLYVSTARDGVFRSRDGAVVWTPFDRFCMPVLGFDAVTVVEDPEGRWLVGGVSGGGVYRNPLEAADDPEETR